jgi:uncharacterized membrane protein YjfL (UPF0719 family)
MNWDMVYWDHAYDGVLAVNLAIVIALFACLRLFSGTIAHIDARKELIGKDNPAFGLSLAGVTFAMTIMLSGVMYGDFDIDILRSGLEVGAYGVLGIILMALTRIIFDKIALPHISLRDEIVRGNMAVAIVDTANVIAAAIILRAVMVWITDDSLGSLAHFLMLYAVSQMLLTLSTLIKLKSFRFALPNHSIETELQDGNIAMALTFAGGKIATALAITIASGLVVHEIYGFLPVVFAWVVVSIIFKLIIKVLCYIAERVILIKVNVLDETLRQRNIAVGALRGVIYIALGLLLMEI